MKSSIMNREIIMKFLCEQDMVKSSDEFENGCILMHWHGCGVRTYTPPPLLDNLGLEELASAHSRLATCLSLVLS